MGLDKVIRELEWRPTIALDEGLRRTVEWYRANEAWVLSVRSGEYRRYVEKQYGRLAA
jgi:dTDP-glucose 4,6-dehydratase